MNNISANQNKPENIQKLAAQRQFYKEAKKYFLWQVFFTVPVTIIISALKLISVEKLGFNPIYLAACVGILISLIDVIVNFFVVSDLRTKGAKVQEDFDCTIYEMPWNKIVIPNAVKPHLIKKYATKYKQKTGSPLEDWYPIEIVKYSKEKAILTCQNTNVNYDRALRAKFVWVTIFTSIGTLAIIIICALVADLSVRNLVSQVFFPFLPVAILTLKIVFENNKSIKAHNELHGAISLLKNNLIVTMDELRSVQDKIYFTRKDSFLIPDYFYNKRRSGLEAEMHDNA